MYWLRSTPLRYLRLCKRGFSLGLSGDRMRFGRASAVQLPTGGRGAGKEH